MTIKGLKGFVKIKDDFDSKEVVFIKVTCTGIRVSDNCEDPKIMVEPVHGTGTLGITPCQWFDTIDSAIEYMKLQKLKEECQNEIDYFRYMSTKANKVHKLLTLLDKLSASELEDIESTIEKGPLTSKLLKTLTNEELKQIATTIYLHKHGLISIKDLD